MGTLTSRVTEHFFVHFICKGFYCGPEQLKKNNRNEFGGRSDSCGSKIQVVPKNYYNLYFFKPKAKLRYHHRHFCHHQHHHHHYYLGYNAIKALWNWDLASQWLFLNSSSLAMNIHIQIFLTDLHTFPWRISWENLIKDQSIWGNLCTLQSGSCFVFIFTCLLAYQHISAYQWSEILRFGDCLLDSRAYFFLVFIIILLPYFKKIGVRVLNITFFFRLATKCGNLVGDIGEDELYAEYRKGKNLFNFLCKDYTKDCVQKEKEEL